MYAKDLLGAVEPIIALGLIWVAATAATFAPDPLSATVAVPRPALVGWLEVNHV